MDSLYGRADLAVILGTGLSGIAERYDIELSVPFDEMPGLGAATAPGHPGRIALVRDRSLLLFLGRLHCYEGLSIGEAGYPARTAAELGCKQLLLTQAAGGLRCDPPVGSWMIAEDIVSLSAIIRDGPAGLGEAGKLHGLVSDRFRSRILDVAREEGVLLHRGTLFWTTGPTYETASEARAAVELGAHAASMSGLPELLTARQAGIDAAVLGFITNPAPSVQPGRIDHGSVINAAGGGLDALGRIIDGLAGARSRR